MPIASLLFAVVGAAVTGGGGYLVGVTAKRRACRQLEADYTSLQAHAEQLEANLAAQQTASATTEQVREEMRSLITPIVGAQQASAAQIQAQIEGQLRELAHRFESEQDSGDRLAALREEIHQSIAPLLQQDRESKDIRVMVRDMLGPLMQKERRAQGLTKLAIVGRTSRQHLPRLLETVATRGGFSAVLLSDEMGLPLAASAGARDADVLAGVSSLILTLADRISKAGGPMPLAVLLRDAANQRILHRIFVVGNERYLVTAVSRGEDLTTDALDPALTALEDVLAAGQAA